MDTGAGKVKFDTEGNKTFLRNAKKVWHFDTVWHPLIKHEHWTPHCRKYCTFKRCKITYTAQVYLNDATKRVYYTARERNWESYCTIGAVMQKSSDIRCLTTARPCQVTWRHPVYRRLVSLRAAVVRDYVQTAQTRKLPTISQWRFEPWTLSIYSRSAGHYNYVCPSLNRTDGRPRVTCRTTNIQVLLCLLIIFVTLWVQIVSDVWMWT